MIEIPLTQGQVALIDADDLALVSGHRWRAFMYGARLRYASTTIRRAGGGWTTLYMHRLLLGLTDPAIHTDHINGNGLDNRRSNLRACSQSENQRNLRKRSDNTSGYKGVHWRRDCGKWRAIIQVHGKPHHLGYYQTPAEAHAAYCKAADELHGKFANYGAG